MYNTQILPDGEVRVMDYTPNTVTVANEYQWTEEGGWKMWINADVQDGGYWRTFTAEVTIEVLERLKAAALASLEVRAQPDESN